VSLGEVADMGDGVLCLTLARRYVDGRDRRHGMTPIEVGIPWFTVDSRYMLRRQIPPLPPLPTLDDSMFFIRLQSAVTHDVHCDRHGQIPCFSSNIQATRTRTRLDDLDDFDGSDRCR